MGLCIQEHCSQQSRDSCHVPFHVWCEMVEWSFRVDESYYPGGSCGTKQPGKAWILKIFSKIHENTLSFFTWPLIRASCLLISFKLKCCFLKNNPFDLLWKPRQVQFWWVTSGFFFSQPSGILELKLELAKLSTDSLRKWFIQDMAHKLNHIIHVMHAKIECLFG